MQISMDRQVWVSLTAGKHGILHFLGIFLFDLTAIADFSIKPGCFILSIEFFWDPRPDGTPIPLKSSLKLLVFQ